MDSFGTAFRNTVHDYVGLYENNKQLKKRLHTDNAVIKQAMNLCTISGPGGSPVYATGSKPGFVLTDPMSWEGEFNGCISLEPFFQGGDNADDEAQPKCLIEDIPNLECHVGNRVLRLAEPGRTKWGGGHLATGDILYYYVFYDIPNVEVTLVVRFSVNPELTAGLEREQIGEDGLNPKEFSNMDQGNSPVEFWKLWVSAHYPVHSDDEDD